MPAPSDFPGGQAHVDAFAKKFHVAPGAWSPYTYDSVLLLADALERAASADRAPDLMLHLGDMAYDTGTTAAWVDRSITPLSIETGESLR